jgi:glycosyltransferase involved in cell wall biosynthesis
MRPQAIIDWPLTPMTGWGGYGIQLAQALYASGALPLLPRRNERSQHCDLHWVALLDYLQQQPLPEAAPAPLLFHALGNRVPPPRFAAERCIGVTFFECSSFAQEFVQGMADLDLLIAGSRWNHQLLQQLGLTHAELVYQGVDTARFNPAPVPRLLEERSLVIVAGGKLEARKGQDVVIAAFRELLRHHPDALLIAAWTNLGNVGLESMAACPHVQGHPEQGRGPALATWLEANHVPLANVMLLPPLVNSQFPNLIKQADVAVFASRCEGGTNLMAMETLACGVPTLLSANTGHLDLLELGMAHALPIGEAGLGRVPAAITRPYGGDPAGVWGETEPDELLEWWLRLAAERHAWRERGRQEARALEAFSWCRSMERLLQLLRERGWLR